MVFIFFHFSQKHVITIFYEEMFEREILKNIPSNYCEKIVNTVAVELYDHTKFLPVMSSIPAAAEA